MAKELRLLWQRWQACDRVTQMVVLALATLMGWRFYLMATLGLGDDEAYYWEWSRKLSLSYYDHPAMVAWLIRFSTELLGDNPLAVRLPAFLTSLGSMYYVGKLAHDLFGLRAALWAVGGFILMPVFGVGGLMMVPDAPMGLLWMAILYHSWILSRQEHVNQPSRWFWIGVLIGLSLLSKYTAILLAFSLLLFFLSEESLRSSLLSKNFILTLLPAILLCLPILIWNYQRDWPSLAFHLHDRQVSGAGLNFSRWGQFWASQLFINTPALFVLLIVVTVMAFKRWQDEKWRFLLLTSLPVFLLFSTQALFSEFKPHWPAPAYIPLLVGLAGLMDQWKPTSRRRVMACVGLFLIPINLFLYIQAVYPLVPRFLPTSQWNPQWDPMNDLYGWKEAGHRAVELQHQTGKETFLASSRYQTVSQLAFATRQTVIRTSRGKDHYSYYQTEQELSSYDGQDAIFVVDLRYVHNPNKDGVFDSCEKVDELNVERFGELAHRFEFWLCKNFKSRIETNPKPH